MDEKRVIDTREETRIVNGEERRFTVRVFAPWKRKATQTTGRIKRRAGTR